MKDKDLREEYDALYKNNPDRWDEGERDKFAFEVLSVAFKYTPRNALDIGCGNGHLIKYLAWNWPEVKYTGIDLSKVAISLAKKKVPKAKFIVGKLGEVKLPQFDLVILQGVAEHFKDLQKDLQYARDTLSEAGLMYVEVPNCLGYPTSIKQEGFRRITFGSRQLEWHLSRASWEKKLTSAGLTIVESIKGPNIFTEFIWLLERKKT